MKFTIELPPVKVRKARSLKVRQTKPHRDKTKYSRKGRIKTNEEGDKYGQ